jgi:tetratricopeptide (TPR) repeat protein
MTFAKEKKRRQAERLKKNKLLIGIDMANGRDTTEIMTIDTVNQGDDSTDVFDMQDRLKDHILILRDFKNISEKKKVKEKQLLPLYLPLAQQGMENEDHDYDVFIIYCAMWLFDCGQIAQAVELSLYVCEHGVDTPEGFSSDSETFLTCEFLKWAMPKIKNGESVQPYFDQWFDASCEWEELNFIERANLTKAAGFIAHAANDYDKAVEYYSEALFINEKVGVKKKLEQSKAKKPIVF